MVELDLTATEAAYSLTQQLRVSAYRMTLSRLFHEAKPLSFSSQDIRATMAALPFDFTAVDVTKELLDIL
jgi:hypothetical protein